MARPRPLYAMAKPPPDAQAQIMGLSRTSPERPQHLLHMTLLGFVDLAVSPPEYVPVLLHVLADFEADPFEVVFDSISERHAVTMRSSKPLVVARAFQMKLVRFLESRNFIEFGRPPPEPHVTINYNRDGKGDQTIIPIGWRVEQILLIESIHGEGRHEPRGVVPLNRLLV
jgi:2'-5' RNA ligase